jgi:hypothetical protein
MLTNRLSQICRYVWDTVVRVISFNHGIADANISEADITGQMLPQDSGDAIDSEDDSNGIGEAFFAQLTMRPQDEVI